MFGKTSGIPACCVWFFYLVVHRCYYMWQFFNEGYHHLEEWRRPRPEYRRCPLCLLTGRREKLILGSFGKLVLLPEGLRFGLLHKRDPSFIAREYEEALVHYAVRSPEEVRNLLRIGGVDVSRSECIWFDLKTMEPRPDLPVPYMTRHDVKTISKGTMNRFLLTLFALVLPHELMERIPKDSPLLFHAGLVDPVAEHIAQTRKHRDSMDRLRKAMEPFHVCQTEHGAVFCLGLDF